MVSSVGYGSAGQGAPFGGRQVALDVGDGHVYATAAKVQVELYTAAKDQAAEEKVEQALSSMYWDKSETVLEDDHAYEVIYQIEV